MPPSTIANLPDWAETRFQLDCDEAGVARNKAYHDRTGWDFLVEFERPRRTGLAHDLQPGSATARVQVKSKRAGSPRCDLKLSNALRFCREPDPCFVMLYRLARDGDGVEIFAREFDEPLMAAALKRAREADRDGVADLHRIRMPVAFAPEHLRDGDLIDWIRARADVDASVHAARKAELNRSLGREEVALSGKVTVAWDDLQALIDSAVGMGPPVEVSAVRLEDVRFGIPARQPIMSGKPDFFRMQAHPRPAWMRFEGKEGHAATFAGEIRSFNLPGLSPSNHRARFTSPCVQLDINGEAKSTLSYSLSQDQRRSLPELLNELSFILAIEAGAVATLDVDGVGTLDMEPVEIASAGVPWARWVGHALQALQMLIRPGDAPQLSFDDIGHRGPAARPLVGALTGSSMRIEMELVAEPDLAGTIRNLAYFVDLEVGDTAFEAIVRRPCLDAQVTGRRMESSVRRGVETPNREPAGRPRFRRLVLRPGGGRVCPGLPAKGVRACLVSGFQHPVTEFGIPDPEDAVGCPAQTAARARGRAWMG